ncbi:MAG: LysR family transcriptional regulator [Bdellovibrionales bacterium]
MKYRVSDIENFVATVGSRTIMEAARKIGISQPALSESLKRLESDIGAVVFYRSRTGIQLTPSGKLFLSRADRVLDALGSLELSEGEGHIFSGKTITIGCHAAVAQYAIPKTLAYIARAAPDYKVEIRHDLSRNIQLEIQRGNIDVGIIINPVEVPDIVIKKIASDIVRVWSCKNSFDKSTIICNSALLQTQHILRRWKDKPSRIINTDSLELICRLTNEALGFGIIPQRALDLIGFDLKANNSIPSYHDQICLVHRPEFGANKSEALVCEAIKAAL